MKFLKKGIKFLLILLVGLIVLSNLIILLTGRFYLYKGLWYTYFKGRSGPSATEYTIFPNRRIKASSPQAWPYHKYYNAFTPDTALLNQLLAFDMHAFVVIKNDSLLYESYWDGFSDTSHTNSFSMAKTYVCALLGCALKEGHIVSDSIKIGKFIDFEDRTVGEKVSLQHLATMSSGIDFNESYVSPFGYPAEGYYGTDVIKASVRTPLKTEPGTCFNYLSGNTALLGKCISVAVNQSLSDYCSKALWSPLGCEQDAWWSLDRDGGQEKGFCCLNSNARDFARLGMLYLKKGNWKGKQLIDTAYIEKSIRPNGAMDADGNIQTRYGTGMWLCEYKGQKLFYARGILGQFMICLPEDNMVIVKLARKRNPANSNDVMPAEVPVCIELAKGLK